MFNNRKDLRIIVISFKYLTVVLGAIFAGVSALIMGEALKRISSTTLRLPLTIQIFALMAGLISGLALVSIFPESLRIKFKRPLRTVRARPTYGFVTLLAIGIGTTIGSPLFIILPVNIVQYAIASVVSLVIAGLISLGIAWVYSYMYVYTEKNRIASVGGPGFLRIGVGKNSVTYFISRLSMWVANTALAAFSAIYFLTFTFQSLPDILKVYGVQTYYIYAVLGFLVLSFAVWFIINAFLENRYLKLIGMGQIVMLVIMVVIIIIQSLILGFRGGWNFSGFTTIGSGNMGIEILENTSYLFILFFGFQEIQSIIKETKETSTIPVISRIFHLKPMSRIRYVSMSMIITVLFSLAVMLLVALSYYAVHPSLSGIEKASLPALYVVDKYISPQFGLLTISAFLIADITTFVPAFIAASRHLRSLSSDGFFPRSMKSLSWFFTLALILVLSFTSSSFLVDITDFMVLAAIGLISFSPFLARRFTGEKRWIVPILSLIIGVFSIFVDIAIFPLDQEVVLLGVLAIALSYLTYDLLRLGSLGLQIFVIFFDLAGISFLEAFPTSVVIRYPSIIPLIGGHAVNLLLIVPAILVLSIAAFLINIIMDIFVIKRVSIS